VTELSAKFTREISRDIKEYKESNLENCKYICPDNLNQWRGYAEV
jgi:hypothetical protein